VINRCGVVGGRVHTSALVLFLSGKLTRSVCIQNPSFHAEEIRLFSVAGGERKSPRRPSFPLKISLFQEHSFVICPAGLSKTPSCPCS